ncbi:MAG: hypothetical protein GY796_36035 [Chloroflexi bacterium]|nr:hypothetical protein [Chloroflexota bacterium]
MTGLFIPIALTLGAIFAAFATYTSIRRGGARFYTLEREAILRRASLTLVGSVLLFLAAIGFLMMQIRQTTAEEAAEAGAIIEGVETAIPTPEIEVFPPTPSTTPTEDASLPTPTATPIICRAVVEGTAGNGLTLRKTPGGNEVSILPESSLITLVSDEAPQEVDGLIWRKVSSVVTGDEGWVAEDYLQVEAGCE